MSYHLILPFFPEELRALLLDPSISDLMINGTTGVYADRNGVIEHIRSFNAIHERPATGRHRARRSHPWTGPHDAESDPEYTLAGRLACRGGGCSILHQWADTHHPQVQPLVHLR